eukprot:4004801-Pyramimonas_sp.AAC.1
MRYETAPPPPPRRLTTTRQKPQPITSDYDLRGHWIGVTIFGLTWVAIECVAGDMRGGDDTRTTGPHWDPAGQVLFREFAREVHAWTNVTTGNVTPSQQAASLQR